MAGWWLGAAAAVAFLVAMVVTGALPRQRQLVRFEARGVMAVAPEAITRVALAHRGRTVVFVRQPGGWSASLPPASASAPVADPVAAKLSMAVQFMHTAAPIRRLAAAELPSPTPAGFGFDDGSIAVRFWTQTDDGRAPLLGIRFGGRNPEDTAQFMTIDGGDDVILMSRFVGAEWAAVAEATLPP